MGKEWNKKNWWITTQGGGPLPFEIRDAFDLDKTLTLKKSYTRVGTKYVRVHVFEREDKICECCGHKEVGKIRLVEVTNTW